MMKSLKFPGCLTILIMMFVLFVSPGLSYAQNKAYRIGPRDVITLTIFAGGEKQQEVDLTVSASGTINIPFIGALTAGGLTVPELEQRITEPLAKDYFVNPEVNVVIKEYHSLQYYISGAVRSPGLYETDSKVTVMELIAKAGGVLPERGNIAYVLQASSDILSEGSDIDNLIKKKEPKKVDLKSLLDKGDMSHNTILQSGDVVYIPLEKTLNLAESKIYVEGEVKKPGVYDFQPGLTAFNACIMAGGFSKFAASNRTRIIRKKDNEQVIIKINLEDVQKGKIPDIELKAGDRLYIPESYL